MLRPPSRLPKFALVLLGCMLVAGSHAAAPREWELRTKSGENEPDKYFGEVTSYSFATKQVALRKADGKEFLFPARDLAFSGKWQLIWTPAFGAALRDYTPPLLPTLSWIFGALAALCLPVVVGLWGSAHVLGAVCSGPRHIMGVGKLMLVVLIQVAGGLVLSVVLDPERPVVPDKNADIVLLVTVATVGLLVASVVISMHYRIRFMKGMAVAILAGVFGTIVATAITLAGLFAVTRLDRPLETLATKLVFGPFGWF